MIRFLLISFLGALSFMSLQGQNLGFQLASGKKKVRIPIEINNNLIVC